MAHRCPFSLQLKVETAKAGTLLKRGIQLRIRGEPTKAGAHLQFLGIRVRALGATLTPPLAIYPSPGPFKLAASLSALAQPGIGTVILAWEETLLSVPQSRGALYTQRHSTIGNGG